jgi:hypothetical protein
MRFLTFLAAGILLASCGDDKKTDEVKTETAPTVQSVDTKGLKIAYYYMDSLKNNFTYYKNEEARINQKSKKVKNLIVFIGLSIEILVPNPFSFE